MAHPKESASGQRKTCNNGHGRRQLFCPPVGLPPDDGMGEHEDDAHDRVEQDSREAGQGLEEPVGDGGPLVRGKVDLGREAVQVLQGLGGDVVEVDQVAARVHKREEERGASANLEAKRKRGYNVATGGKARPKKRSGVMLIHLVELQMRVDGDVLMQGTFFELGKQVP